jgi:agmatinase
MLPTLLGIPFDAASSYQRGAAQGPAAIRAALHSPSTNGWSEDVRNVLEQIHDAGDVDLSVGDVRAAIDQTAHHLCAGGARVIALGGDHSITYPLVRAVSRRLGAAHFSILHLDAHPDLYPEYEGDRYSHACPFARIMDEKLTHRLVQVGIRCMNEVQRQQADAHVVDVIDMRAWTNGVRPRVRGPVYLSLDLDVFDPGFAPGVSHREPGGLTPRDVITLIQELEGPLVGADVVELNPSRDPLEITAPLAAKLVKEIAATMLPGRRSPPTS